VIIECCCVLHFFFLVNCFFKQPTIISKKQPLSDHVIFEPSLDTCNLTYKTFNSVMLPDKPSWIPHLIIASPLVIGTNPTVSEIGFYIDTTGNVGTSYVDILIYDSKGNGPGVLRHKITNVNLDPFPAGQISCIPFSNTFTIGETIYVGFWTYTGNANKVISRQYVNGAQYWYNTQGLQSPSIGSSFPTFFIASAQVLMGFVAGNTCTGLPCGGCTQNSGCVWCINSQSCISTAGIPQCPSWTRNPGFCHACQQFENCENCASLQYNCSWCETNGFPSVCLGRANDGNCTTAITDPKFCNL